MHRASFLLAIRRGMGFTADELKDLDPEVLRSAGYAAFDPKVACFSLVQLDEPSRKCCQGA